MYDANEHEILMTNRLLKNEVIETVNSANKDLEKDISEVNLLMEKC